MIADVAWIVLHGGSHEGGGILTFETAFGGLVTILVVVGALYYLGVLEQWSGSSGSGGEESDAGVGD